MSPEDVRALKDGDRVFCGLRRADIDTAGMGEGSRWLRVVWGNGLYDVVDRLSPLWRHMEKAR